MPVKRTKGPISLAKLENAQKRGLILAGKLVSQRATGKAPIDTGRLKRSITASTPRKLGPAHYAIEIGTNVEYAIYQEFGTGNKSIRPQFSKDPSKPGIPPHPFLIPALEESRAIISKLLRDNIIRALK
jgi:HK97 gp10 family phage protein